MKPIIQLIASSVAPGTWRAFDEKGVSLLTTTDDQAAVIGSITAFPLSLNLIIRHTNEVHAQIGERLDQLRRLPSIRTQRPGDSVASSNSENQPRSLTTSGTSSGSTVEERLREVERKIDQLLSVLGSPQSKVPEMPR
jgi:hypothetical protein